MAGGPLGNMFDSVFDLGPYVNYQNVSQVTSFPDLRMFPQLKCSKTTREELGHSVAGCARTTGHDCARTNPSRVESVVAISAEKKLISS